MIQLHLAYPHCPLPSLSTRPYLHPHPYLRLLPSRILTCIAHLLCNFLSHVSPGHFFPLLNLPLSRILAMRLLEPLVQPHGRNRLLRSGFRNELLLYGFEVRGRFFAEMHL